MAPDACAANTTNGSILTALTTGTLVNVGDAFSISGTYDSTGPNGGDFDFYTFDVMMDGTSLYDVRVSLAYGCSFSNGGNPGAAMPEVVLYQGTTSTTTNLLTLTGGQRYDAVNGSGQYGFGSGMVTLNGPAGANGYALRVDDVSGTTWCMDHALYVELVGVVP